MRTRGAFGAKLTYANVMSTLGVFIALGGTSYAVARNSIGEKHLRRDAVTSPKVKDGSLTARDLAPATIVAGPRGARGQQGSQGPSGSTGPQGPRGPASVRIAPQGASVAMSPNVGVRTTVTRLDAIPAGEWLLQFDADERHGGGALHVLACRIVLDGEDRASNAIVVGPDSSPQIGVRVALSRQAVFSAIVQCSVDRDLTAAPSILRPQLTALELETIQASS